MALVQQLNYGDKNVGVQSNNYDVYYNPINGSSFNAGGSIIFEIGGKRGQYLNPSASFLRFKIANATHNAYFDNSAHCVIDRLVIYGPNGALLEDIQNYHAFASIMADLYDPVERTSMSISGCETKSFYTTAVSGNLTAVTSSTRRGDALTAGTYKYVALNLFSSIIGQHASKFLPIGALNGSIRIELTLSDATKILVRESSTPTVTITDVEFVGSIIEIDPESQSIIEQANGGEYKIHLNQFHNSVITLANTSTGTQQSLIGASRFASLKGYLVRFLNQYTEANAYSTSSSVNPTKSIQLVIGNKVFPNQKIDTENDWSEAQMYLRNFFHAGSSNDYLGVFTKDYNNNADGAYNTTTSYLNATTFGLNTDNVNYGKSMVMYSGLNTLNSQSFLNMDLAAARGNSITIPVYAMHDSLLTISGGVAQVSF